MNNNTGKKPATFRDDEKTAKKREFEWNPPKFIIPEPIKIPAFNPFEEQKNKKQNYVFQLIEDFDNKMELFEESDELLNYLKAKEECNNSKK